MKLQSVYIPSSLPDDWLTRDLAQARLWVVCLCASWCGTCRSMTETLNNLAAELPNVGFVALDIERDSALVDELDIDDFPTFAFFQGERLVYFGTTLPQQPVIKRLIENFAGAEHAAIDAPAQILSLPAMLGKK